MKEKSEHPYLVAQSGPLSGNKWMIVDEMIIGREKDCDIVIPDRQVSRYHAKIVLKDDSTVELEDLGSKNGTFINKERINKTKKIRDGDLIKIAIIQDFLFVSSDATLPLISSHKSQTAKAGKLLIDDRTRRVWVDEKEIIPPLSVQQFKLLQLLYDHCDEVVPRERIFQQVWELDEDSGITEQALDALVRRLRDRLSEYDNKHDYLITVRGFGIRLDNPDFE